MILEYYNFRKILNLLSAEIISSRCTNCHAHLDFREESRYAAKHWPRICKGNTKLRTKPRGCSFTAGCDMKQVVVVINGETSCKCDKRRRHGARLYYKRVCIYACINNVEPDPTSPVKLRAYVGCESPADCFAERAKSVLATRGTVAKRFPRDHFPLDEGSADSPRHSEVTRPNTRRNTPRGLYRYEQRNL